MLISISPISACQDRTVCACSTPFRKGPGGQRWFYAVYPVHLLALGLIAAAGWALREPLAALSASYGSQFALKGLDALHSGMVLLGTVLLGWLGARVVTGHFLRQTRPTET